MPCLTRLIRFLLSSQSKRIRYIHFSVYHL
jgi:hypothetical protein